MKELKLTSYDLKKYTNEDIHKIAKDKGFDVDAPIKVTSNRSKGIYLLTQDDDSQK